jgi:hypothetical protein
VRYHQLNGKLSKKRETVIFPLKGAQRKEHRDFHADYHSSGSAAMVPMEEYEILHLLL